MRPCVLLACLPLLHAASTDPLGAQPTVRKRACSRRNQDALTPSLVPNATGPAPQESSGPGSSQVAAVSTGSASGFDYGTDKIRGVNLGGWLVPESFVTPSLFSNTGNDQIVDEWTFCQLQDRSTAELALRQHWDTYITEDDFKQIADAGLNHVRIPLGYWAWDVQGDEPFIQGAAEYLDRAIEWARNTGIKVLIDLHGAPGSQNGYDHSGKKGGANWHTDPANVKRTVDLVQRISAQYGTPEYSDTVTMFQLLNEPTLWISDEIKTVTKQFYTDAYEVARRPWGAEAGNQTDWIIVFHDGFQPMKWWADAMQGDGYEKLWIDNHYYQAFGEADFGVSAEEHIRRVCNMRGDYETSPFPSITGEFSIGVWSCAPAEGSSELGDVGTCSEFDQRYDTFLRAFFDIQVQVFENVGPAQGWFFFNWKTEGIAEWSYQLAVQRDGWVSSPPGEYRFDLDTVCGST